MLSQDFGLQMFDEAKKIFKLDLEDQLKNISPDVLSKIKKRLALNLKLVHEPLMQNLKDEGIWDMKAFNMFRSKCLLLHVMH